LSKNPSSNKPLAFVMFDIETNGNNPVCNSMLSISLVLMADRDRFSNKSTDSISYNLNLRQGTSSNRATDLFWARYQDQYEKTRIDTKSSKFAFNAIARRICKWSDKYELYWTANPSSFDWTFFIYYWSKFVNNSAIDVKRVRCVDISSLIRVLSLLSDKTFQSTINSYHRSQGLNNDSDDNIHISSYDAYKNACVVRGVLNDLGGYHYLRFM
jgi:hypothetical protein